MLPPGEATPAAPAAEHRVARDASSEPYRIDTVAQRGHGAGPLVPDPHRVRGFPGREIRHVAREELVIGATQPGALDVDHDLARSGGRSRDVLDLATARLDDDERAHGRAHRPRLAGRASDRRRSPYPVKDGSNGLLRGPRPRDHPPCRG